MDIVAISGGRYPDAVQPPVSEDEIQPVEAATSRTIKEKTSSFEDLHIWTVMDKVTISAKAPDYMRNPSCNLPPASASLFV